MSLTQAYCALWQQTWCYRMKIVCIIWWWSDHWCEWTSLYSCFDGLTITCCTDYLLMHCWLIFMSIAFELYTCVLQENELRASLVTEWNRRSARSPRVRLWRFPCFLALTLASLSYQVQDKASLNVPRSFKFLQFLPSTFTFLLFPVSFPF